eukprot:3440568-Prymnesium_polylepis.1
MSPLGPKVLYGSGFSYQKWCECLTPRYPTRIFYCTNALLRSSGIFLSNNVRLDRSRSAGILGHLVGWFHG